jgi:hypothetical protein
MRGSNYMAKKNVAKVEKNVLSLDVLNNEYKTVFGQKSVVVKLDDKDYIVLVDEVFRAEKLQALFNELVEKRMVGDLPEEFAFNYMLFLIFKYFTDLEACQGVKTLEEQMKIFHILVELNIAKAIVDAVEPKEIEKMMEFSNNLTENLNEMCKNMEAENAKLSEKGDEEDAELES